MMLKIFKTEKFKTSWNKQNFFLAAAIIYVHFFVLSASTVAANPDCEGALGKGRDGRHLPAKSGIPLDRYTEILTRGIQTQADLKLADELLNLLEPDDAAILHAATKKVPHVISDPQPVKEGGGKGYTQLPNSRVLDRRSKDQAENVTLIPLRVSEKDVIGVSLIPLKHERVHATQYDDLPEDYRLPFDPVNRGGTLKEIYEALIENLQLDEALAFSGQVHTAKNFEEKTGLSFFDFLAQVIYKSQHEEIAKAHFVGGVLGVKQWVKKNPSYFGYHFMALKLAISFKQGGPKKEEDFGLIHPETLLPAQVYQHFKDIVEPLLAAKGTSFMVWVAKLALSSPLRAGRTMKYFTTKTTVADQSAFFENDFPWLVEKVGTLLESEPSTDDETDDKTDGDIDDVNDDYEAEPSVEAVSSNLSKDERALRRTQSVQAIAADLSATNRSFGREVLSKPQAVVEDQAHLFGTYVDLLEKLSRTTDRTVVKHLDLFLTYAESADGESASSVYSFLLSIYQKDLIHAHQAYRLGVSLIKGGYREKGIQVIKTEMELEAKRIVSTQYQSPFQIDFSALIEMGEEGLVLEFIQHIKEFNKKEFERFQREAERPIKNFAEHSNGISSYMYFVRSISESLTKKKIVPSVHVLSAVESLTREIWAVLNLWMKNKIAKWQKKFAPKYQYRSVDELTAQNPQSGGGNTLNDAMQMVGFLNFGQNLDPAAFVKELLECQWFYTLGLQLLDEFPESLVRVELFEIAAEHMPEDFTSKNRQEFRKKYQDCILANEQALIDWSFLEEKEDRGPGRQKQYANSSFKQTHFYQLHFANIGKILLSSQSEEDQNQGREILRNLSSSSKPIRNSFYISGRNGDWSRSGHFSGFIPAIFRAHTLFEEIDRFDEKEIPELLDFIFSSATSAFENKEYGGMAIDLVKNLLTTVVRRKDFDRYSKYRKDKNIAEWMKGDSNDAPKWRWDSRSLETFRTDIEFLDAIVNGTEGLDQLAKRVESDTVSKRKRFSLSALLKGLELLSSSDFSYVSEKSESAVLRLIRSCIDRYLQQVGGKYNKFFGDSWVNLVSVIKNLSVPSAQKDIILTELIEKATPRTEAGFTFDPEDGDTISSYEIAGLWNGFKVLEFVLNNPETPKAEALLLNRLAKGVDSIGFSRDDARVTGSIQGLAWVYQRVATDGIADPALAEDIKRLLAKPDAQRLAQQIFGFHRTLGDRPNLKPFTEEELWEKFNTAVTEHNLEALNALKKPILASVASQLLKEEDELGRRVDKHEVRDYLTLEELRATHLGAIEKAFLEAKKNGQIDLSKILLDLLLGTLDGGEIFAKRFLLISLLTDESFSLEERRKVFSELKKTTLISNYASTEWDNIIKANDPIRENLFYGVVVPWKGKASFLKSKDGLIALVLESSIREATAIVNAYAVLRNHQLTWTNGKPPWTFDPMDEGAWQVYAHMRLYSNHHFWDNNITNIFESFVALKHGWNLERLKDAEDFGRDGRVMEEELAKIHPHYYEEKAADGSHYKYAFTVKGIMRHWSRMPTLDEANRALTRITSIWDMKDRCDDRIRMAKFELPEVFKKRSPLIQFLISRYFSLFPRGEQQEILRNMEKVPEEEALRAFISKAHLEKLGQFLSFWPEVPLELREELSYLQDKIPPSDWGEVVETIEKSIPDWNREEFDAIIANLNPEPLGSGTIGEVYESKNIEGKHVVVKVITPSKERNFRIGMERLASVRRLLAQHETDIEGAREAGRFIDMYLAMVEKELNLSTEFGNAEKFAEKYAKKGLFSGPKFYVPKYYGALSSARVLVMDFVSAEAINDVADRSVRERVLKTIKDHFLKTQVLGEGFYQTDFQPKNILVDSDGKIWLIDFGQMGEVDSSAQSNLKSFLTAYMFKNPGNMVKALEKMASQKVDYDDEAQQELTNEIVAILGTSQSSEGYSSLISRIFSLCLKHGLLIDHSYIQLTKALATLEGTEKTSL